MMRLGFLLSIFVASAITMASAQEAPNKKPNREEGAVFSEALADFLDTAVNDGVLRRPVELQEDTEAVPGIAPETAEVASPPEHSCLPENPYNFRMVPAIASYADLAPYQAALSTEEPGLEDIKSLIKGYILLGLFAEAQAVLRSYDDAGAADYRALATLLEHRAVPDMAIFHDMASCHPQAGVWLSLAQIVAGDPSGAAFLSGDMAPFRALPVRLRVRAAEIALPAMRESGDILTATKIISSFSAEEKQNSSRLQFQIARFEAMRGGRQYHQQGDQLLGQSATMTDAFSAVVAGESRVTEAEASILLERVDGVLRRAQNDRDTAVILSFALEEYSKRSDYQSIIGLMDHPKLASRGPQGEVVEHLLALIRKDLQTQEPDLVVKSASLLIQEAGRLSGYPDYDELVELAANAAIERGSQSLAATLLTHLGGTGDATTLRAEIALRKGDHNMLYQIAENNSESRQIGHFASIAAVRSGNKGRLVQYLARYQPDLDQTIYLIEEDAIARHWVVPDTVYLSALAAADGAQQERLGKIDALRQSQAGSGPVSAVSNITEALRRTASTQAQLEERAL